MRPLLVALLAVSMLAGCFGSGGEPADPTDEDPALPTMPLSVVHGPDAVPLPLAAYPGDLPVVVQRYVDTRESGEPTIAISRNGVAIYPSIEFDALSGLPVGAPTDLPKTVVYRRTDEGLTWTDASPVLPANNLPAAPASLDPYVYADPVTGRLFSIDLNLAVGGFLSWSDDDGQTWMSNPGCCGLPVDDHQTLFSGPATVLAATPLYPGRVLYFCINQVADAHCTHSLDGGVTWSASTPVFLGYETGQEGRPQGLCGGLHGHGHASEATGTVFLPKGHCGQAWIGRSTDNGMTWDTILVDNSVGFNGHEAIVSTDRAGNVYYFFLDEDTLPRLSISTDDGQSWSAPINVTAPGVTTAKFPSIVAGEEGRIAFLYVGSTTPAGARVHDREGGRYVNASAVENATWNAYVGFSLDALAASPVFATVTAHPLSDPLARGPCPDRCYRDSGGMYDFLDIDVHPLTGQVWVALVDMCNEHTPYGSPACNGPAGTFQSYHKSRGAVGVQTGGTLLGTRLP
jgi:hypothetical protein